MTQRYEICDGDTTTAGGRVIVSNPRDTSRGRGIAYEYDLVWCPKCQSDGHIVCRGSNDVGPDGRRAARSEDWCVCKCEQSPLLLALQRDSFST
jgi:uncharacterized Zn-binding protein involved in type VI secretion